MLANSWRLIWTNSWLIIPVFILILVMRRVLGITLAAKIRIVMWLAGVLLLFVPVSFPSQYSPYQNFNTMPILLEQAAKENQLFIQEATNKSESEKTSMVSYISLRWIWLAGMGIGCCVFLVQLYVLRQRLHLFLLQDEEMIKKIRQQTSENIVIYQSETIVSCAMMGWINPKLIVGKEFFTLNENEQTLILQHEQVHLKYGHRWFLFFLYLLQIIYWFHPLVWLTMKYIKEDLEYFCDEHVASKNNLSQQKQYADLLLKTSQQTRIITAQCFREGNKKVIKERIQRILPHKKLPGILLVLVIAVVGIGCLYFRLTPSNYKVTIDSLSAPIKKYEITCPWGCYEGHEATDMRDPLDDQAPILASERATVLQVEQDQVLGNYIILDHGNEIHTLYGMLSEVNVLPGEVVKKGQTIGLMGMSGQAVGPHLHYQIFFQGQPIDPWIALNKQVK